MRSLTVSRTALNQRWLHAHGCQRWFNALRDTVSDRIKVTYRSGEPRPE